MEDIRNARKKSVPQSVKLTEDELEMVSGGDGEYYGRPDPENEENCPKRVGGHVYVWYFDDSLWYYKCSYCGVRRE